MPYIRLGSADTSLFYEDFGMGAPVVLLHGWPLSGRFWEHQLRALVAAGHRVVCPDRRGFGRSGQPWDGYDYDTFAADLAGLIDALALTGVTLVGHSTGCGDVVRYAVAHPARLRAVVLADPLLSLDGGMEAAARELAEASVEYRIAMLDDVLRRFFSVDGQPTLDQPTHRYLLGLASAASPRGTTDAIIAWTRTAFADDLARLDLPALVVHGGSDAFVPSDAGPRRIAALIPGARRVEIPHAPHATPYTHPEQWTRELLDFMTR